MKLGRGVDKRRDNARRYVDIFDIPLHTALDRKATITLAMEKAGVSVLMGRYEWMGYGFDLEAAADCFRAMLAAAPKAARSTFASSRELPKTPRKARSIRSRPPAGRAGPPHEAV